MRKALGADRITQEVGDRLLVNMRKLMLLAQRNTVKSISRSNSGGNNPSLPGEPPKAITRSLARSIRGTAFKRKNKIVGRLSAGTVYAARLEFGFVGTDRLGRRVNQAPRPYLRPGLSSVLVDPHIRILKQ